MENVNTPKPNIDLEIQIKPRLVEDDIVIGNTGVIFRRSKQSNYLELVFNALEKSTVNPENVTKLSLGLLGFYRWANSDNGKDIVTNSESSAGNTNRKFFDTLLELLEKGGHSELFLTYYDGTVNVNAGIHAAKFADLPTDDPLIRYLEKIETRSGNPKQL